MHTVTTLYVIELKLNKSADAAMQQIDLKHYPERFALCGLPVVKVGIDFDGEGHTLGGWKIMSNSLLDNAAHSAAREGWTKEFRGMWNDDSRSTDEIIDDIKNR